MTDLSIAIDKGRTVRLSSYLSASLDEQATIDTISWIKALRHAVVGGEPLRRRFTFREDSLWWFAELYLHKQQVMLSIHRTLHALEALVAMERPASIQPSGGTRITRWVAREWAREQKLVASRTAASDAALLGRVVAMDARATWLHTAALGSRLRGNAPSGAQHRPTVAAFVHRAFWRSDSGDGSAESYIGPVLKELEQRLPAAAVAYVGVGPTENFGARRWWHPVVSGADALGARPVERFSTVERLGPSRRLFAERHALRRALWESSDLRDASRIRGCDCWPLVREELAGVALLQWTWSARAMDEAAAALDSLEPSAALTYAEAGGWGRAIALECRRRRIPLAGLQHGFIYRHWLNYLHAPDEMRPDPERPADAGFPRPARTLLFDGYAAQHLLTAGAFPPESLAVTGSPKLDGLVRDSHAISSADRESARERAGAPPGSALMLVATKHREAAPVLAPFLDAAARVENVHVVIKTHPAETPAAYEPTVSGRQNVSVLPGSAPLAPLLAASRALVTVNSTLALDAAVLGIPSLVLGLPNNLSPFVEAGLLAAATERRPLDETIRQILYNEEFRQQLEASRRGYLARFEMRADGQAAARTARAVLDLAASGPRGEARG